MEATEEALTGRLMRIRGPEGELKAGIGEDEDVVGEKGEGSAENGEEGTEWAGDDVEAEGPSPPTCPP